MFAPLRRWTGAEVPEHASDIGVTVAAMDAADVDFGLLSACSASHQEELLIGNDDVAAWVRAHPDRFAGLAAVNLDRPMDAVRELRRCVTHYGFKGLRAGRRRAVGDLDTALTNQTSRWQVVAGFQILTGIAGITGIVCNAHYRDWC
jgi:predicted TIM-barrel fold metal-dependent hydrolase